MQQVNDGVRPLNSLKQEDLELKTLKSIKNQFQEGKAANKSEEIKFEPQIVESVFRPETPLKENIRQIRKQII
jgi:ABC-type Zn2+ transport system substrate-binding protein/surface adhesin